MSKIVHITQFPHDFDTSTFDNETFVALDPSIHRPILLKFCTHAKDRDTRSTDKGRTNFLNRRWHLKNTVHYFVR